MRGDSITLGGFTCYRQKSETDVLWFSKKHRLRTGTIRLVVEALETHARVVLWFKLPGYIEQPIEGIGFGADDAYRVCLRNLRSAIALHRHDAKVLAKRAADERAAADKTTALLKELR